jgi:hypothetical protein
MPEPLTQLADADGQLPPGSRPTSAPILLLCQVAGNSMLVEAWRYLEGRIRVAIMNGGPDNTPPMMSLDWHCRSSRGRRACGGGRRRRAHGVRPWARVPLVANRPGVDLDAARARRARITAAASSSAASVSSQPGGRNNRQDSGQDAVSVTAQTLTPTWQLPTLPSVPEYCRATPGRRCRP